MTTEAEAVKYYVSLRDKKKQMKEEFEAACRPYTDAMGKIEAYFLGRLNETGLSSMPFADAGTVFTTTILKPTLINRPAAVAFVKETGNFDLFTNSVSKEFVAEWIAEHKAAPPGVQPNYYTNVNVRRA